MIDDRISERRFTFHENDDDEMLERHWRCQLALVEVLSRDSLYSPTSLEFLKEFNNFRFACVPECVSLRQVYDINNEIAWQTIMCESVGITLFKIPRLVNDLEGYVTMLVCEHLRGL